MSEAETKKKKLVEQVLVRLDDETYARVERLTRALERADPQMRQASRAGAIRSAVARGLAVMEAELGIDSSDPV